MKAIFRRFATAATRPLTLKDLKSEPLMDFVVSSDFYRIDVGMIIYRRPIFLYLTDMEVESIKRTHQLNVKYDMYAPFPKEFGKFDRENIEEQMQPFDDRVTHIKKYEDGSIIQFRPFSKSWKYAQPDVYDHHQFTTHGCFNVYFLVKKNGRWMFPQVPANHQAALNRTKDLLMMDMSKDQFKVMYTSKYPMVVQKTTIHPEDIQANPYLKKCVGRKVFYFPALHDVGHPTDIGVFDDFAWVPKPLLNKYLSRSDFDDLMPHLPAFKN